MAGRRVERLNEQFRRELTEVVRGEARDPRLASVTITAVRVAPDLTFARVYIAPTADASVNTETLAGLSAAAPFLRRELGTRLQVRRIPELHFQLDESLARGQRIESLLHEVAAKRPPEAPSGSGDASGPATPSPHSDPAAAPEDDDHDA
jgi:ribosome-binding factor A